MKQTGNINIKNRGASVVVVDIEGVIGLPEEWQFESPDERVATYAGFSTALDEIRGLECDKVRVNIRSTGGNLNDALLIHEALCALPAMVETHCYGYVASAATIIAQAASVGARYVSSGSLYLIHNSRTSLEGSKSQALRTAEMLDKTDARIAQIYADRSGLPIGGFETLMNACDGEGQWLTPDEVIGYGLADVVEKVTPLDKIGRKIKNFFSTLVDTDSFQSDNSDTYEPTAKSIAQNAKAVHEICVENSRLKQEVRTLQNRTRRLQALPTVTNPKEDPSPTPDERRKNGNLLAYDDEIAKFV